jgi:hypothetical protein
MGGLEDILNEDDVKSSISELCKDIADFDQVDFVLLSWSSRGRVKTRYYGDLDFSIAVIERVKFVLLMEGR